MSSVATVASSSNMSFNNREKKDDDESTNIFQGIDKGSVLQEKRIFHETPPNSKKCCHLLIKLLYLLEQGEKFTQTEATDVFFAVTQLFQSQDLILRRMVYLVLKELIPMTDSAIIVVSSLNKDINSKIDFYKSNGIRVLFKITDASMLTQADRYVKQAIVDKEPAVSSAALVSAIHILKNPANTEVVRRWHSEINDAIKSKSAMVQYHAMSLFHQLKEKDRLAVSKFVNTVIHAPIRSVFAYCFLIRLTKQVLEEDPQGNSDRGLFEYLESCLRHKSEVVVFEAARALCDLKNISPKELTPAISVLQLFLGSSKPTLRFAAVRTLNKVAMTHPLVVTSCNLDMENLISDPNRSIATLAITTLLKTGAESSVDRLMKQISNFMNEISDEFKIVVVQAIKALCLKFPQKHRNLISFLSLVLRDEGGYEFKKAIVDTLLDIIYEIPDSKEVVLTNLCEFIEDCEFTLLAVKILSFLGREGPLSPSPSKYIRHIYNRVILENANIRASAIAALAKFALRIESLRPQIIVLLRRCLVDNDDEVRDRATFYLTLFETDIELAKEFILDGDLHVPLSNLETALVDYNKSSSELPFDIAKVSTELPKDKKPKATGPKPGASVSGETASASAYAEALSHIPEFAALGPLFKSSKPAALTEKETDYVVTCIKHVFPAHLVLQFNITNTISDQLLENAYVKLDLSSLSDYSMEKVIPAASLPVDTPGVCYVSLRRPPELLTGSLPAVLKFTSKDVDPQTGEADETGYDDQYQVQNNLAVVVLCIGGRDLTTDYI